MACTTSTSLFFMRETIRRPLPSPCSMYHSMMQQNFPIQRTIPPLRIPSVTNNTSCYINKTSKMLSIKASKLGSKCLTKDEEDRKWTSSAFDQLVGGRGRLVLDEMLKTFLNALKKSVIAGILLGALLLSCEAFAASGGRMGGSSSYSSSGSSSGSSSHSSSGSSSHSSSGSSSGSSHYIPSSSSSSSRRTSEKSDDDVEKEKLSWSYVRTWVLILSGSLLGSILLLLAYDYIEKYYSKKTLFMLQVGLLGMATKSLQRELNQIAETANTSTSEGLDHVLRGTSFALLWHQDCCISCYSTVGVEKGMKAAERHFKQLSMEECKKFDEETLVNVNNVIEKKSMIPQISNRFGREYMVVTILLVTKGVQKFPVINSKKDLRKALEKLVCIRSTDRKANWRVLRTEVEVLWTPQQENDTLSESEYLEDYPRLRPLD